MRPSHTMPVTGAGDRRVRRLARAVALVLLLGPVRPDGAAAQDTTAAAPPRVGHVVAPVQDSTGSGDAWLSGLMVGLPGAGVSYEPGLFTIGGQWTRVRPGRPGLDLAIGTMPRALQAGVVLVGTRAGVALPVDLASGVLVLPSAGVSALGAAGTAGGGVALGLTAGLSAAAVGAGGTGARAGITWHFLSEMRQPVWLLEVGLVRRRD